MNVLEIIGTEDNTGDQSNSKTKRVQALPCFIEDTSVFLVLNECTNEKTFDFHL